MALGWIARDGGLFLDLSAVSGAPAGLFLAVRPHAEDATFRPCAVLEPGEAERELGDGVLGLEHAQDTIVKYALQVLSRRHGLPPDLRDADDDAPWAERTVAALWRLLEAAPHSA